MGKLDSFRKLIREEVRAVFQEELSGILKEAIMANRGGQMITETKQPVQTKVPGTLNTAQSFRPVAPILSAGNPLNNLLAETAKDMTIDDFEGFGAMPGVERDVPIVESVNDMFASARVSSNIEAVQINAVPDFTHIMQKMKANGEI